MFVFSVLFLCLSSMIFIISGKDSDPPKKIIGTHLVASGDTVRAVPDSFFKLKNPGDLVGFLQQEKTYEEFVENSLELIKLKKIVDNDEVNEADSEEIERGIYSTDKDCLFAEKLLFRFDLYVGTVVFAYHKDADIKLHRLFEEPSSQDKGDEESADLAYDVPLKLNTVYLSSADTCSTNASIAYKPDERLICMAGDELEAFSVILDLGIDASKLSDLDTLSASSSATWAKGEPIIEREDCIFRRLGLRSDIKLRDLEKFLVPEIEFGDGDSKWNLHLLSAFYWRHFGRPNEALECTKLAYATAPSSLKSLVLLSAVTILERSNSLETAAILLEKILEAEPDNSYGNYVMANLKAIAGETTLAAQYYDKVIARNPGFLEAKRRRAAVACHEKVEVALQTQHETLKETLKNLKAYNAKSAHVEDLYSTLKSRQADDSGEQKPKTD